MFTPTQQIPDLWHYLQEADRAGRPIVLYGMGNGADKILETCRAFGITVRDCFASDGFVRGHTFHGRRVLTFAETCEKYGAGNLIVLLAFATSRPEVLALVRQVAATAELYVPDVPVCGEELFTADFCHCHGEEFTAARALLADETSRWVFDGVVASRLSGSLSRLLETATPPEADFQDLLQARRFRRMADLGAYNGDSLRELMTYAPCLETAVCMEPDPRTFRRLVRFTDSLSHRDAEGQTTAPLSGQGGPTVYPVNQGAWSETGMLTFSGTGNRNASLVAGVSCLQARAATVPVAPLDRVWEETVGADTAVDYIKYDVEGAEAQALVGSRHLISRYAPALLVSVYHRSADLFSLPLLVHDLAPHHALYLRRRAGVPAWDINLLAVSK